jgi:cysteine-rich repeat protein
MVRFWFAMIATSALLLSTLATRAEAVSCQIGCGVASGTCKAILKNEIIGCERNCQEVYDADPNAPNAAMIFDTCRQTCKLDLGNGKTACENDYLACRTLCQNASLPSCANLCGDDLFLCAQPITLYSQSCFAANNTAAPLLACAATANPQLDACFTTPVTGFDDCMANLGCNSICGNGIVEAGENCDDNGTSSGDGCSHFCQIEDADGDTILDDGSGDTVVFTTPCPNGVTTGCDDNCPYDENPGQEDADGDSVGDVCDQNCAGTSGGSTISGGVYANSIAPANGIANTEMSACKIGTSCCSYTTTDANGLYTFNFLLDGTYNVEAFAPGNYLPGITPSPIALTAPMTVPNTDFVLNGPVGIPPGVTIGNSTSGVPGIQPWNDITLEIDACVGATVTYSVSQNATVLVSGNMTQTAPPGHFEVTVSGLDALLIPNSPSVQFAITVSGCGGPPDGSNNFDAYIDPSGYTRYVGGDAAVGATVVLFKGPSLSGPWTQVPNGSAIMSPKNRTNPDLSDAEGHFGWDVIAGYYLVRAEIQGCEVESYAMTIPPEVTNLELVFECPCIAGPRDDCRSAGKGQLSIKDDTDDAKDSFKWKWSNGIDLASVGDLGLPLASTAYDVCIYTGSGNDQLTLMQLPVLAGWEAAGTTGYKYKDSNGVNDGIGGVSLKSGDPGKPKIQIKGKGSRLPDPALGSLTAPITIQLQPTDLGECYESVFGSGDVDENSTEKLKVQFP